MPCTCNKTNFSKVIEQRKSRSTSNQLQKCFQFHYERQCARCSAKVHSRFSPFCFVLLFSAYQPLFQYNSKLYIQSQSGVHKRDPLGPLLLTLAFWLIINELDNKYQMLCKILATLMMALYQERKRSFVNH